MPFSITRKVYILFGSSLVLLKKRRNECTALITVVSILLGSTSVAKSVFRGGTRVHHYAQSLASTQNAGFLSNRHWPHSTLATIMLISPIKLERSPRPVSVISFAEFVNPANQN